MIRFTRIFALLFALSLLVACGSSAEVEEVEETAPIETTEIIEDIETEEETVAEISVPDYETKTIAYDELIASDGTLIANVSYTAPVYEGDGEVANMLNSMFANLAAEYPISEFQSSLDSYEAGDAYIKEMSGMGMWGTNESTASETYRNEQYVSFNIYTYWFGYGAHGGNIFDGITIDVTTGQTLTLADVLTLDPDTMAQTIYDEAYAYFSASEHHYAELMIEESYIDGFLEKCGEDAEFWLASDGVHIYFEQYTFFYAAGSAEFVIPYTRTDLIREDFIVEMTETAPEVAPEPTPAVDAYKEAYSQVIRDNFDGILEYQDLLYVDYDLPCVAIYDLTGDGTPELSFVTFTQGAWKLYVYTYDRSEGAVPLLADMQLGVNAGAPSFAVSAMNDGDLLIYIGGAHGEGGDDAYHVYSIVDGAYKSAHSIYDSYLVNWDTDELEHSYKILSLAVDEESYTGQLEQMQGEVCLKMFDISDPDFADDEIMFIEEALAYLG